MYLIAVAMIGADIGSPVPLEQRVAALEAKVAALESKCSACQCGPSAKTPVPTGKQDLQVQPTVCGPNGCYPVGAPASVVAGAPVRQFQGGDCSNGQCGPQQRGGFRLFGRRGR